MSDEKREIETENKIEEEEAPRKQAAAKVEQAEEEKLRSKFPMAGRPMPGQSAFLHKRLTKGVKQKYFDSGDYQMARQNPMNKSRMMPPLLAQTTGDAIPTPDSVPVRKTSIIQHSKLTTAS